MYPRNRRLGVGMGAALVALVALCPISRSDEAKSAGQAIGVDVQKLGEGLRDKMSCHCGVFVGEVEPGSPADRAGVEPGDVIVMLGSSRLNSPDDLRFAESRLDPSESVMIAFARNGGRTVKMRSLKFASASAPSQLSAEPQFAREPKDEALSVTPNAVDSRSAIDAPSQELDSTPPKVTETQARPGAPKVLEVGIPEPAKPDVPQTTSVPEAGSVTTQSATDAKPEGDAAKAGALSAETPKIDAQAAPAKTDGAAVTPDAAKTSDIGVSPEAVGGTAWISPEAFGAGSGTPSAAPQSAESKATESPSAPDAKAAAPQTTTPETAKAGDLGAASLSVAPDASKPEPDATAGSGEAQPDVLPNATPDAAATPSESGGSDTLIPSEQDASVKAKQDQMARLGVHADDLNPDLAAALAAPKEGGVIVLKVLDGSPAALAGLRAGDVICQVGKQRIWGVEHLSSTLQGSGNAVAMVVRRKGVDRTINVSFAPPAAEKKASDPTVDELRQEMQRMQHELDELKGTKSTQATPAEKPKEEAPKEAPKQDPEQGPN